jgi:hypothetical protein
MADELTGLAALGLSAACMYFHKKPISPPDARCRDLPHMPRPGCWEGQRRRIRSALGRQAAGATVTSRVTASAVGS